jgi:oligopeptidase B
VVYYRAPRRAGRWSGRASSIGASALMLERTHSLPEPHAKERTHASAWHGVTLADEFAWLKATNWREVMRDPSLLDSAIRGHLEAENAYAERVLGGTTGLQRQLFAEMMGRIRQDDATVPVDDGCFAYYLRYREGGQHPLVCRRKRDQTGESILIDGDALAAGKPFFQLGATRHSPDHRFLAWASDGAGSEAFTIRVRDTIRATDLGETIHDSAGGIVWAADGSAFYYVRLDGNHRPSCVLRHRLGAAASSDELIYEEAEARYFVSLSRLQAGRFAEISIHDHETSESWLIDLQFQDRAPRLVAGREQGLRYDVEHHPFLSGREALLLCANHDGAEDFKLAWAPLASPDRHQWVDIVAHRPGCYIIAWSLLRDWLVRLERENGLPRIVVRHLESAQEHAIAFSEDAYSLSIESGYEFDTNILRFNYSSMTTPAEVWDYDLTTRTRSLRKRQEIPSGHDPSSYVTRRLMAPTADGELVPVSILHRRTATPDGSAPCLLYGYGAYGISIPAAFNANRLSLVDRGFVYAIAHVRGGTEKGWRWYREGKLADKHNSFRDFIAAAEYLIAEGWARRDRIVAHGGSAGGMLMGVVANSRPELFAGIVAEVPFVDVLNTMLDKTLPLTPPEWLEWGNPVDDRSAFELIRSYSPYDNIRKQDYPAMLVLAGLTDARVFYWEPAKWVARLRSRRTDQNLLAFRTNMEAGHTGAAGRFERLREIALGYAFALAVVERRR